MIFAYLTGFLVTFLVGWLEYLHDRVVANDRHLTLKVFTALAFSMLWPISVPTVLFIYLVRP